MKIAVTSQNRKTVTEHAGHCRKFWIYTIEDNLTTDKALLELSKEESFHESEPDSEHPLDGIDVLLTAGTGGGLPHRLERKGIRVLVTGETDPDMAVQKFLQEGTA